jgi:hypothetical protein
MSGVMFFAVLFCAVTIQAQRMEGQRRIDQLDKDIVAERDQYRALRADVAEQESPERIMAAARALDMVEPGPVAPLIGGSVLPEDGTADEDRTLTEGATDEDDASR